MKKNQKYILAIIAAIAVMILIYRYQASQKIDFKPVVAAMPFGIPPTEEQKKLLMEIDSRYGRRIMEIRNGLHTLYSPKQWDARKKAAETIQKQKLKGKAAASAMEKALAATPEQKKKEQEMQAELTNLVRQMYGETINILSADQRVLLDQRMQVPEPKK